MTTLERKQVAEIKALRAAMNELKIFGLCLRAFADAKLYPEFVTHWRKCMRLCAKADHFYSGERTTK